MPQVPYESAPDVYSQWSSLGKAVGSGVQKSVMDFNQYMQVRNDKNYVKNLIADTNQKYGLNLKVREGESRDEAEERAVANTYLKQFYDALKQADPETVLFSIDQLDVNNVKQAETWIKTLGDQAKQVGKKLGTKAATEAYRQRGEKPTAAGYMGTLADMPGGERAIQEGAYKPFTETLQKQEREDRLRNTPRSDELRLTIARMNINEKEKSRLLKANDQIADLEQQYNTLNTEAMQYYTFGEMDLGKQKEQQAQDMLKRMDALQRMIEKDAKRHYKDALKPKPKVGGGGGAGATKTGSGF